MAFDLAGFKPKRKRGGQADRLLRYKQLEIAMTYYRFFYVDGDTRTIAIKKTEEEFRRTASRSSVVSAVAYYDSQEGRKYLQRSPESGLLLHFKMIGSILDDYRKKGYWEGSCIDDNRKKGKMETGKPFPYWLEELIRPWRTPKK